MFFFECEYLCLNFCHKRFDHFLFQINLLDVKRSMNANIFLKQFKNTHEEIVKMIQDGEAEKIGSERLRGLSNILPDKDEVRLD